MTVAEDVRRTGPIVPGVPAASAPSQRPHATRQGLAVARSDQSQRELHRRAVRRRRRLAVALHLAPSFARRESRFLLVRRTERTSETASVRREFARERPLDRWHRK